MFSLKRDLNVQQRRWMEYMEDYDFALEYHLDKANVMVDPLSRKLHGTLANMVIHK